MITLLYEQISKFIEKLKYRKQNEALARARKLEDILMKLQDSDEETESSDVNSKLVNADVNYQCMKIEGIITQLGEAGGMINGKYHFAKSIAKREWTSLKIGTSLSFFVFEGVVRSIEIRDDICWDDQAPANPTISENPVAVGYDIDHRTVLAVVVNTQDDFIIVSTSTNQEFYVHLKDYPNLEYNFSKGDNLRMDCIIQEDETFFDRSGRILKVKGIRPANVKREIGRVASVHAHKCIAVFEQQVVLIYSAFKDMPFVSSGDKWEYEAIETTFTHEDCDYNWRITKLLKNINNDGNNIIADPHASVQLYDRTFAVTKDSAREITFCVAIYNVAAIPIRLLTCNITNNSRSIRLDKPEPHFQMHPLDGKFNIFIKFRPKEEGIYFEEITAVFENFQKKCLITINVQPEIPRNKNNYRPKSRYQPIQNLVPGQKFRNSPRFIDIKIKDYQIPDTLRIIDFKKQPQLVIQDLQISCPFMFESLCHQNYVNRIRFCIYLEEIEMEIAFGRYKIQRAHFENKQDYLRLEVKEVNERRPSISLGDSIRATDPFPSNRKPPTYEGFIHKVENDAVLVKFHTDFHHSHARKDYRIEFFFSRSGYKRQQHAIDMMSSLVGLGYDFLFPKMDIVNRSLQVDVSLSHGENLKHNISGREFEWFDKNLNIYQKKAVINVLRGECRPLPFLIYGPPGSGKTKTIIECILQIFDKVPASRIVVATPSNSAANLITEKLIESELFKPGDFIRFVSYNQIEKELIPDHLKKHCGTISIAYDDGKITDGQMIKTLSGLRMNCSKTIIKSHKIYISTLSSVGPLMQMRFPPDHFTHVIIDEAGQSTEPETMIPITLLSKLKGQVILAGDPKQLGPVLISPIAKILKFDVSFLERLSEHEFYKEIYGSEGNSFDERFVTKLKKNYRSIPSILSVYNKLFYNEELEGQVDDETSKERQLLQSIDSVLWNKSTADRKCGVYFVNVGIGKNERIAESSSWFNNFEAGRIFKFVCNLKSIGMNMKNVGIITPYALQVKNLKRIVNESMPGCDLKIGTVEEFQGQERDIILISTVRTDRIFLPNDLRFGLGFLQCPKRINVAISRARALLVIFGKESILAQDDNWLEIIQYAKAKGTYVSEKA